MSNVVLEAGDVCLMSSSVNPNLKWFNVFQNAPGPRVLSATVQNNLTKIKVIVAMEVGVRDVNWNYNGSFGAS